jgi:hypothetical protein
MAVRFRFAHTLCLALVLGTAGLAPAALAQQVEPPGKQEHKSWKKLPFEPAVLALASQPGSRAASR